MDKKCARNNKKYWQFVFRYLVVWAIVLIGQHHCSFAQELFPTTEPASTMPKHVYGFRQINELYKDLNGRGRYFSGFRLMYGLNKNITVMAMVAGSNHHLKKIPDNFTSYLLNHHKSNYPTLPFLAEGIHVYSKIRIFSDDGFQKHFRIAFYIEGSKSFIAHIDGESNLMTDNSGIGGGLIVTKLNKRFAASLTTGYINSFPYKQGNGPYKLVFKSGNVFHSTISLGYRVFPKNYSSYKNLNVNVYSEFNNRLYNSATINYNGLEYDYTFLKNQGAVYTYKGLIENYYSEMRTSVQFILDSNNRIDIGVALPLFNRTYLYDYPMVFINLQKYIFK